MVMASEIAVAKPDDSEYEIVEGGTERVLTGKTPWINPETLKLRHRIGRGSFGDVWLATNHKSTEDYDEHHEVAIKMLHPINEDQRRVVLNKIEDLFSNCEGMGDNVCQLRGVSSISGRICIVMKFYEGCLGDKIARVRGGKLSMANVLRYGIDLASGILELHSKGIVVLNLKPSNFLLSDNDRVVLGDLGIPSLFLGVYFPSSDTTVRLGTPNYMAPEQWEPEVRGPLSFETDSWGFGCAIVEMLTGSQPWSGRSADEIYDLVVIKQEKPSIPHGISPLVENLLSGCFMYDLRSRPSMADILHVFKRSQNTDDEAMGTAIEGREIRKSSVNLGYTEWFISKDHLQMGDRVRSRKPAGSSHCENMDVPEGTVVGLERDADLDGFALVKVHGRHDPLRVHVSVLERVTRGLAAGDWVRLKHESKKHSPVGILHSIDRDGGVAVGFIGLSTLWEGASSELQMAEAYSVGQIVRPKPNVVIPRFKWPRKRNGEWAAGKVSRIMPNGCLAVKFPGLLPAREEQGNVLGDPSEVEVVTFSKCEGVVKKYEHLEDFHWAVRPLVIAMGILTAMKLGFFVGKTVGRSNRKKKTNTNDSKAQEDSGKSRWRLFRV